MITKRTNARISVLHWMSDLRRKAAGEKAEFTGEEIEELAEPMFSMCAASEAADPDEMRALLQRPDFKAKAQRYLEKNWFLIAGLPPLAAAERERQTKEITVAAKEAISLLVSYATTSQPKSLANINELTEKVGKVLSHVPGEGSRLHGENTATLLREALGLPGDAYVSGLIRDPAITLNAANALTALGATIDMAPFWGTDNIVHKGRISDWRVDGPHDEADAPLSAPVSVTVKTQGDHCLDVFINDADRDGTLPGQASIRIEREADVTRFMIYDANCSEPRVFGVRDGEPVAELPNDWEARPREEEAPAP